MRRAPALLLLFAVAAWAGPSVVLIDGRELDGRLDSANAKTAKIELPAGEWTVPTQDLVALREGGPLAADTGLANLYLKNGDALRGTVLGAGAEVSLSSKTVTGLQAAIEDVRAVRFGRLMGTSQERYDEVFRTLLAKGRDSVLIQRQTRPFPVDGRVLSCGGNSLKVRIGEEIREIDVSKVYAFVRSIEKGSLCTGFCASVRLNDGGLLTLPFESLDAKSLRGAGIVIDRGKISRIDFVTGRYALLSSLDPIDEKLRAAFGKPLKPKRNAMVYGGPLRLDGRRYETGVGVHAYCRLEYALTRRWNSFFVRCGIDDAAGKEGGATFRVLGDGKTLAEATIKSGEAPVDFRVNTTGVDRLVLETLPGESYTSDLCDWALARVFNEIPMTPPPGTKG